MTPREEINQAAKLAELKRDSLITGASQDGFTVCIHSFKEGQELNHCFRIDKAIGAYIVALLHAHGGDGERE